MPGTAIYTDLSGYYDLMCADIDYGAQSSAVQRLQQLFGNGGRRHWISPAEPGRTCAISSMRATTAAGWTSISRWTGPRCVARRRALAAGHVQLQPGSAGRPDHLLPVLDPLQRRARAARRLYRPCARRAGRPGLFCFNAVDKQRIDNRSYVSHTAHHADGLFGFSSGWYYSGEGERQLLRLRIEKTLAGASQVWQDEHPMVAVSFAELIALLEPYFEVHVRARLPEDRSVGHGVRQRHLRLREALIGVHAASALSAAAWPSAQPDQLIGLSGQLVEQQVALFLGCLHGALAVLLDR